MIEATTVELQLWIQKYHGGSFFIVTSRRCNVTKSNMVYVLSVCIIHMHIFICEKWKVDKTRSLFSKIIVSAMCDPECDWTYSDLAWPLTQSHSRWPSRVHVKFRISNLSIVSRSTRVSLMCTIRIAVDLPSVKGTGVHHYGLWCAFEWICASVCRYVY